MRNIVFLFVGYLIIPMMEGGSFEPEYDGSEYGNHGEKKLAKEAYHFQEPDISIVGDNFQPYNKKLIGYPGREGKLEAIEKLDMTELWKNLRGVRNEFDKYVGTEGNSIEAVKKLNKEIGKAILFHIPDLTIALGMKEISGLTIYAHNFRIVGDGELYFSLGISTSKRELETFLCKYFDNGNILSYHSEGDLSIHSMPCNEPLVTEYVSNIVYSYKQLLKFKIHKYYYNSDNYNDKIHHTIDIKKLGKNNREKNKEILDLYLRKNNPDLNISTFRYYIGKESYFKLEISNNKLQISFNNTPFELAEYWYDKVVKEVKQVEKIILEKYKLIEAIEKTSDELIKVLSKNEYTKEEKQLKKDAIITHILQKFQKYKKQGDYIESDVYITFLEDLLEDTRYLTPNDLQNLNLLGGDNYKTIIRYYTNLIKREITEDSSISTNNSNHKSIFEEKYTSPGEQENYINYILNLLEEIDSIYPKIKGLKGFLEDFSYIRKQDIQNIKNYRIIGKYIIKWLDEKEEDCMDFTIKFTEILIKTNDIPYLFKIISKGNGKDIQTCIDKCLDNYKDTFPTKLIALIEQILWQYSFMTTIFFQYTMLERDNMENLDFSLFDHFANKPIYPENLTIDHVREGRNEYETSGQIYYNINKILSTGKQSIEFQALDIETLKTNIIRQYYNLFKEKYEKMDEKYAEMFMPYFSDEQKIELEKIILKDRWMDIIKRFETNETPFEVYDKLIEDMKLCFSSEGMKKHSEDFQDILKKNILKKHLQKVRNNKATTIGENQMIKILSYLSEKQIKDFQEIEIESRLEGWLKSDIAELKQGIPTIDASKYQGYDITNKNIKKQILEMIKLKQKNDKKYIIENKESDMNIDSIIAWYDILKEYFPKLTKETQDILRKVYEEGDKNRGLLESFQDIETALKDDEFDSKSIDNFIKALDYYIDISYIDINDVTAKEKKILKKSIVIIFSHIFTEDNKIRDVRKIAKFLSKLKGEAKDLLLLGYISELYDLENLYPKYNLKHIHILIGIMNKILEVKFTKDKGNIIRHTLINHLIKLVNNLEKNDELSYDQTKDLVDRVKSGEIKNDLESISNLKNSEFVMMLKYF